MVLPSGLHEIVGNEELISRFLTSHGHCNASVVKPGAYLPNRKNGKLSVARHSAEPISESQMIAKEDFGLEKAFGVALLDAEAFRDEGLDFEADDTPPRHADVIGWPWLPDDPEFGKSIQKLKAASLAQKAARILYPITPI